MTDLLPPPEAPERPRIDPRFARRWIEARREEGRQRLHLLIAAGTLVGCAAVAAGSLFTPLLHVRHLRISVNGPVPAGAVGQLSGVSTRALMIEVDPARAAARLDGDPWLGGAKVVRRWPGTVTISVSVRAPIALVARPSGGTWAEVDETGRVLADVASPPGGVPFLTGVASVPPPGGWLAGSAGGGVPPGAPAGALVDMDATGVGADVPSGPAAALAVLADLPPALRADVDSVSARPGAGPSLLFSPPRFASGAVTVVFGDGSGLQAKVTAFLTLIDQADLSGVSTLDLSVPSRPAASGGP
ncbi:MAG TPA: FtsQ-type POTRA domain-containing protein [Acidimicrobiales bacterium]|nr:FtsQ-type POTRA domain-containing protein [Acidimicrobiales bacterium]